MATRRVGAHVAESAIERDPQPVLGRRCSEHGRIEGAAAVAVAGVIIAVTGRFSCTDPAAALVIAVVIGYHVVQLLRDVASTLRQRQPSR